MNIKTGDNEDKPLQSQMTFAQKVSDKIAKYLITCFGTVAFFLSFLFFVLFWVSVNLGYFSTIQSFDPFPFIVLVLLLHLFEVFLSIIVLISQNRQDKIAEVRQQIDLEINVRAENEITKILQILDEIQKRSGISKKDEELEDMKEKTNLEEIKEVVETVLENEKKINTDS